MAALEVLVVETEQGAAAEAAGALEQAGHHVHRCHRPGDDAFPCVALTDRGRCPVEGRGIDVALTVRGRPRTQPAPLEDGLSCAIRHHVPVVVAGKTALHPYGPWVAAVVADGDDLVGAVEEAAGSEMHVHHDAALGALQQLLELHGREGGEGAVRVRRHEGGLAATIAMPADLEQHTADMAAVRVAGALRLVDPDALGIDVAVDRV